MSPPPNTSTSEYKENEDPLLISTVLPPPPSGCTVLSNTIAFLNDHDKVNLEERKVLLLSAYNTRAARSVAHIYVPSLVLHLTCS